MKNVKPSIFDDDTDIFSDIVITKPTSNIKKNIKIEKTTVTKAAPKGIFFKFVFWFIKTHSLMCYLIDDIFADLSDDDIFTSIEKKSSNQPSKRDDPLI